MIKTPGENKGQKEDNKPQKEEKKKEEIKTLNNKGDNKNQNKSEKIRRVLENKPLNNVVIGIDLVITNTCAAILKNDKIEIIKNDGGEKIIPSVVCYTEKKTFVGTLAKNKMYQFPESTVFESKSLLGKRFEDCKIDVKEDMGKRCHVKIIEDKITKKAKYEVNIKGKKKRNFSRRSFI